MSLFNLVKIPHKEYNLIKNSFYTKQSAKLIIFDEWMFLFFVALCSSWAMERQDRIRKGLSNRFSCLF